MQTYLTSNSQLRIETNESIIENLKRKGWVEVSQPFYNPSTEICEWKNGQWVINNIVWPSYTAQEWVQQYFSNLEVIALMRLEQGILIQGKTLGPKMEASKQWLESMLFAPSSSTFPAAPYSYSETSAEAAQTLSSN